MARQENWRSVLATAFERGANIPFKYGVHDCCLSVCNVILEFTGEDLAKGFRGYRSEKGAKRWLDKYGSVLGIATHVMEKLGKKEIPLRYMTAGDLGVVVDDKGTQALCVMGLNGRDVYSVGQGAGWMVHIKYNVIKCWRI